MPRLNLYEQQTSAQGPRASGADFGAAPAQALEGAGNALYDIGERIQRRDELLAADQVMTDVDTWALTALDDFSKRQDITSQQSLPEFQNALKQKRAEALSKFTGRPEARAALERQLDNQLSQYGKSAISTKIKAGHALMTRAIDQQLDKSANQVGVAPQIMEDAIAENVAYVNSRKDAMSAEMYQAALTKAQAAPIQAAVMYHIQNGAWDAAEAVMADPRFSKLLAPEQVRPLRIEVAVGRGKAEAETVRQNQNVAKFTMRFGRPLTPDEEIKARSLPAKKDMTPADEITELELVQGKPASQDQVDKIFKTYIDGGKSDTMFGNGTQGRAMAYVTEKAVEYANGFLSPAEARRFEASYTDAYMPKDREDPVTGTMRKVVPTVPKFAEEAMRRGAAFYGGLTTSVFSGTGDNIRPPGETTTMFIDGKMIGSGVADASGRWSIPAPPEPGGAGAGRGSQGVPAPATGESPVKGRGLWSMASKVAGPVAGAARWWGSGPVPMGVGQEEVAAEQYVINQQKSLVRALQQNPRYAEGERKSIEQDIAIKPETMGNPRAFQLRLVEIGKYIDEELRFNAKVLQNPTGTTVQQRQQAMQSNAALSQFYDQLELPPRVKSLAEAQKLPSNVEEFLDENWILRDGPARRRK